jgi:hypothetical protein
VTTRPVLTVLLPIILIGLIATAVALIARQDSDPQFTAAQKTLATLPPAVLERFIAAARDPRPGMGRHKGISARCVPHGGGELRNPWFCTVKYPVGPSVRYGVIVNPTGQVQGSNSNGSLVVYGCCVVRDS